MLRHYFRHLVINLSQLYIPQYSDGKEVGLAQECAIYKVLNSLIKNK